MCHMCHLSYFEEVFNKIKNQDLLYPQGSDVFFSKRVLDAFADEKIVGYDIIKGGCFYCTVETTDEI